MSEAEAPRSQADAAEPVTAGLRRAGSAGLELLALRAELLATELEAEKLRWFEALARLAITLLLAATALALLAVGLVWLCPAPWRWAVALSLGLMLALAAWLMWRRVALVMAGSGSPFARSLEELARDRASLGGE